ncbi:hypothetical protein [Nocardia rhizosphaerae]|uniref:Lipoprotein n=1 Tax=Nocardia rhizosphaerae TaxID=1691571 RepID=A0ABV8KZ30_9NOCA
MHRRQTVPVRAARAGMLAAIVVSATVTGCADTGDDSGTDATTSASTAAPTTTAAAATTPTGPAFDPQTAPLSTAELGEFPYFAIPAGFENPNSPEPIADRDRVPVWTGSQLRWVVGKVYQSPIYASDDRTFSKFELLESIDQAVADAGGVKVTESKIPQEFIDSIDKDLRVSYSSGLGDIYNNKASTYLVRRPDRLVWIHVSTDSAGAGWIIAEEQADETGGN